MSSRTKLNSSKLKTNSLNQLFEHQNTDAKMGALVLKQGQIKDKLCFDEIADKYRLYKPSNGVWETIAESAAVLLVAETIGDILRPMYHLQSFRELTNQNFNRKNAFIRPKSLDVKRLIGKCSEKMKNSKEVLTAIRSKLIFKFDSNKYPNILGCFTNGTVDLTTGKLLGPAPPDWGMTQTIPHAFDPFANTEEINKIMQSFFPEPCYPGDSKNLTLFLQNWKGYSLTGHLNVQKALFMTGRGSNGKSVLNNLDITAWGDHIYRNLSMASFTQEGSCNNDHLYQIQDCRAASIVENTTSGKMNEEIFKKVNTIYHNLNCTLTFLVFSQAHCKRPLVTHIG